MGNSSSNSKASVRVALEYPQCTAGQVVRGYVEVQVRQPMSCKNVYARFLGEVRTSIRYTQTTGSGQNRRTTYHDARSQETIVEDKIRVASFPDEASPGLYQFPFEFRLHPRLPSTAYVGYDKDSAGLSYSVEVQLERPGFMKWDLVSRTPVDIVALVPHTITPAEVRDRKAIHTCGCFYNGEMDLTSSLQKNAYCGGEAVVSEIELENNSSKDGDSVNLELVEVIHLNSQVSSWSRTHRSKRKTVIARRQLPNPILAGSKFKADVAMQLPFEFQNCSVQSSLLQISHYVQVCAETACFTSSPRVKMPVTLYRSPRVPALPQPAADMGDDKVTVPFLKALPYHPNDKARGSPIVVQGQVVTAATPSVWAEASAIPTVVDVILENTA